MTVEPKNICFSRFGSQGDGASFTTEELDFQKLILTSGLQDRFPQLKNDETLRGVLEGLEGEIRRESFQYVHENTVGAYVSFYSAAENDPLKPLGDDVAEALEHIVEEIKNDLCKALYRNLEATYYNAISDENIRDSLCDKGELYFADGRRAEASYISTSRPAKQAAVFLTLPSDKQEKLGASIEREAASVFRNRDR